MKLEIDIPKHQYNNIMSLDSINLGRVPYKGIIMYAINAIKRGKTLEQESTTKNNLAHNLCDSCTNIRCEFQSGIVRTKCAFYMPSVTQLSSGLEKNSQKLEKDFCESDCIDRAELLKAMDTWDKFGLDSHGFMRRITKDKNTDLATYVHYEDMVDCSKAWQ